MMKKLLDGSAVLLATCAAVQIASGAMSVSGARDFFYVAGFIFVPTVLAATGVVSVLVTRDHRLSTPSHQEETRRLVLTMIAATIACLFFGGADYAWIGILTSALVAGLVGRKHPAFDRIRARATEAPDVQIGAWFSKTAVIAVLVLASSFVFSLFVHPLLLILPLVAVAMMSVIAITGLVIGARSRKWLDFLSASVGGLAGMLVYFVWMAQSIPSNYQWS